MRATAVVLLCLVPCAAALPAQVRVVRYGDDRLAGITEVDVLVSVASGAGPCAVARTPLEAAARDVLQQARVRATVSEKASSWFYSVLVTAIAKPARDTCAVSVAGELVAEVQGAPEADRLSPAGAWGSLLVGHMPLVRFNELVIAPAGEHDAAVRAAVRSGVTTIAERLRAANP